MTRSVKLGSGRGLSPAVKKTKSWLGRRYGGWSGFAQTSGVESQGFHFAVRALGGQRLAVEFKVERADVASFHNDFFCGMDGFFGGSGETALQYFVSIRSDEEPGIGM